MKKIFTILCLLALIGLSKGNAQTAPNLGTAAKFVFLSQGSIFGNGNTISATGQIGSPTFIDSTIFTDDTVFLGASSNLSQAINDMDTAMVHIDALSATSISGTLGGQTLGAGIYGISGVATLNGKLTLTGSDTDIYIFDISDSLIISSYDTLLYGNVLPCNIYWRVHNSVTFQDSCFFQGIVLAGGNINSGLYNHGKLSLLSQGNISLHFLFDASAVAFNYYSFNRLYYLLVAIQPWTQNFCDSTNPGMFYFAKCTGFSYSGKWPLTNTGFSSHVWDPDNTLPPTYPHDMLAANEKNGFQYFAYEAFSPVPTMLYKLGLLGPVPTAIVDDTLIIGGGGATCDNFGNYWWINSNGILHELTYFGPDYVDNSGNISNTTHGNPMGAGCADMVFEPLDCNFYAQNSGSIHRITVTGNTSSSTTLGSGYAGCGALAIGTDFNLYGITNSGVVIHAPYPFTTNATSLFTISNSAEWPSSTCTDASSFICYDPLTNFTYHVNCDSSITFTNTSKINGFNIGDTTAPFSWNNITYTWNFGCSSCMGNILSTDSIHVTFHYPTTGIDTITLCVNGCPTAGNLCVSHIITINPHISVTISSTNVTPCNGGTNGTATATASNGYPIYTYLWSNTATTSAITGLSAGNYTVTVTDTLGCTATAFVTITQPFAITATITSVNDSCHGNSNGSATVTASGGTGALTYLWSNTATTTTITGLAAGTYTVTVTDSSGCTKTATVTLTQPAILTASITASLNDSCNGSNNGSAAVSASGGTSPYGYLWSNSATTSTINSLIAGIYSVTVTDANHCTATATDTIFQPNPIVITITSYDSICQGYIVGVAGNGIAVANVSVSGGTPGYIYAWSPAAGLNTVTGATVTATSSATTTYTVTVTDANGCTATATWTVGVPILPLFVGYYHTSACPTASATVYAMDGTPTYSFVWSTGATAAGVDTSTITGLSAGIYFVTVTDAHGCTRVVKYTIAGPPQLTTHTLPDSCGLTGNHNGEAWVTIIAGTGTSPFTYNWSTGATTDTISNLASGSYTVTVTDSAGCTATATAIVSSTVTHCPPPAAGWTYINHVVSTTEDWNTIMFPSGYVYVKDTITVLAGKRLIIDVGITVEFSDSGKIIVQQHSAILGGGILELKGCTLTSTGDCMWNGIDVYGDSATAQYTAALQAKQGQVLLESCTIENAKTAIYLGNSGLPTNQSFRGGIVNSTIPSPRSKLINNTMGITFPNFYHHGSASIIKYVDFISDTTLNDACYTRPLWFINIAGTDSVTMNQDTFLIYKGNLNYNVPDTTFGIEAVSSYFHELYYCGFRNVNRAIDVSYSIVPTKGIYIRNNTIYYSQTGIRFNGGYADSIRYDTIRYSPLYTVAGLVNGVITNNAAKVDVRDDTVSDLQYGITVNNCTKNYTSRIWNNTVSNCTGYGIGTGGNDGDSTTNAGLFVYCNILRSNDTGWKAYNQVANFNLPEQGKCAGIIANNFPPGNSFYNGANPDVSNGTAHIIKYDVETGSPLHYAPDGASTGISGACSLIPATRDTNAFCGFQNNQRVEESDTVLSDSTVMLAPFDSVAYYLINGLVGNAIVYLDNLNTLDANQMLVDIYISINDYSDAQTVLGNIYPDNQDIADFLFVRSLVCRFAINNSDSVSNEELLELQDMAVIGSSSICQSDARGILASLFGTNYPVDCFMVGQCQDGGNERKAAPHLGMGGKEIPWLGNNHPNPFSDWTDIPYYLPPNSGSAELIIFDMLGNKMDTYQLTLKEIQATLTISSKNYSAGVYFCTMVVDGKKAGWKKLLIIK